MGLKNNYLTNARKEKNNEFYTQKKDIESECSKFTEFFKGKNIYCPCDNSNSKFPEYFKENFDNFGLAGLFYSSIDDSMFHYDGKSVNTLDCHVDILSKDFDTVLKYVDVVVTNPPFSLFRTFLNKLIAAKKEFLIIGPQNAITCKSVFKHIKDDGVKVDYGFKGIAGWFDVPDDYEDVAKSGGHIEGKIRVSGVVWYTNLPITDEKPFIELKNHYYDENGEPDNEHYMIYDNFRSISGLNEDCINVDKVKDIPCDYYGYMGVPISFFEKYNPKQFELIQLDHYGPLGNQDNVIEGVKKYRRLYIRLRKLD